MILATQRSRALLVVAIFLAVVSFGYTALNEWPSDNQIFVYAPNDVAADDPRAPMLHFEFLDIGAAQNSSDVYCSSRLRDWPNAKSGQVVSSAYKGYEYCALTKTEWDHFAAKFEVFKRFVDHDQKLLSGHRIEAVALASFRWIVVVLLMVGTVAVFGWIRSGSSKK